MGYFIERVKKQLQYHKKLYVVFILEIAIGVLIFISCINVFIGWIEKTEELKSERVGKEMTVSYSNTIMNQGADEELEEAITYSDYKKLKKKYKKDLEITYAYEDRISYAFDSENLFCFSCFMMDKPMYFEIFGSQMDSNNNFIYMGENTYSIVEKIAERKKQGKELIVMEGEYFEINEDGTVSIDGFGRFVPKRIENKKGVEKIKHPSEYATEYDDYKVADCAFLPLEYLKKVKSDIRGCAMLKIKYKNNNSEVNKVPALLIDLTKAHKGIYIYTVPKKYMNLEERINNASFRIEKYFYASVCILLIVMAGMIGVMTLLLHQRRHSIAIGIAYGSTIKRMFWELFAEILTVFETGGGIGLLASVFVIPFIEDMANGKNTFHIVSIPVVILIMAIGAFLIAVFSTFEMRKLAPAQVLKEL